MAPRSVDLKKSKPLFNSMLTVYLSPTGSFRVSACQTLSEARSLLYQRRFLRPRRHFSAFFELYIFPLYHSWFLWFFKTFAPVFANLNAFFTKFQKRQQFLQFLSNFHRISSGFHRISVLLTGVMSKWEYFREIWKSLLKILENKLQNFRESVRKHRVL